MMSWILAPAFRVIGATGLLEVLAAGIRGGAPVVAQEDCSCGMCRGQVSGRGYLWNHIVVGEK